MYKQSYPGTVGTVSARTHSLIPATHDLTSSSYSANIYFGATTWPCIYYTRENSRYLS